MEVSAYHNVKIEQFEGPLDLLSQLIDSRELEITTISLVEVTDQYINCLKQVEKTCPSDLADFLILASRLIFIKSKALLPILETREEVEQDTEDLKRRLEEYRSIKILSKIIGGFDKQKNINFSRMVDKRINVVFSPPRNATPNVLHKFFDKIFKEIFTESVILPQKEMKELIKLEDKIEEMRNKISNGEVGLFKDFIGKKSSKIEIIVSFLAMLHLLKRRIIMVEQNDMFGDIAVSKAY